MCIEIHIVDDFNKDWKEQKTFQEITNQGELKAYLGTPDLPIAKHYNSTSLDNDVCLCPIDLEKALIGLEYKFDYMNYLINKKVN